MRLESDPKIFQQSRSNNATSAPDSGYGLNPSLPLPRRKHGKRGIKRVI
jgi:hypothetical protein